MALLKLNKNPLLLFVVAVCLAILLPALFMDGMFMDGVFYASVSKNYAQGTGTLWNMVFSQTHHLNFHEQPPLMFVFQGMFFRVLGDSLFTERFYCLVAAIINGWLVLQSWKLLTGKKDGGWFPLLIWFIMPVTFWAFINNVEECTMSIFALLAFNSVLRATTNTSVDKPKWWIIAGCWIIAAGLTKGIQGMFLLSAPFWMWLVLQRGGWRECVRRTFLIGLPSAIFTAIAWLTPVIHDSVSAYFISRFGKTFSNETATGTSHFHMLYELFLDSLPVMGIALIFLLFGRRTPGLADEARKNLRIALFVLACGFSGIIPLMITLEQRGFYLVTALPMITLPAALMLRPIAERLSVYFSTRKMPAILLNSISGIVLITTIAATVMLAGKPKRDRAKLEALGEIHAHTGNAVIRTSASIDSDWGFITYAQRFHGISVTATENAETPWLLLEKGSAPPENYTAVPMSNSLYSLFIAEGSDRAPY